MGGGDGTGTGTAPNATRAAGIRSHNTVSHCTIEDNGISGNVRSAIDFAAGTDAVENAAVNNVILGGTYTSSGVTCHSGCHSLIGFKRIPHTRPGARRRLRRHPRRQPTQTQARLHPN